MDRIVVLSGPIASGKSRVAEWLRTAHGFSVFKSREILAAQIGKSEIDRAGLQRAGEALDRRTKGRWVADEVLRQRAHGVKGDLVVDAARIELQIEALRKAFGRGVIHVHVTASDRELASRYAKRKQKFKELNSYSKVRESETEARVHELANVADVIIDTDRCDLDDVYARVGAHLGLNRPLSGGYVDVIVGGQYGSEGKGQIAGYLASEYDVLVRVGGANAGHSVWAEPRILKFHLLPSGTVANPNAQIVLGPGAVISLRVLLREISEFGVDASRLAVDPKAMVVTPDDVNAEGGIVKSIGSTGQGVGAATARKVRRQDVRLAKDFSDLKPYLANTHNILGGALRANRRVLLEGTQGTALSLHHGPYPHVTSRDTTSTGCLSEAGIPLGSVRKILMVCRTYPIRVGGPSGPMKGEISWTEVSRRSGLDARRLRTQERTTTTNRKRRVGEFDWELLRWASDLNRPTDIALTFVDYVSKRNHDARRFDQLTPETVLFIEEIERVSRAKVSLISTRFHARAIIDRRNW